jgi:predicted thioredoxin/glutaredoxin
MSEQQTVMLWQNAEAAVGRLGLKIEVSTDLYRVVNDTNPTFAKGANWSFATLDGILGWVSGIDLGRMMK